MRLLRAARLLVISSAILGACRPTALPTVAPGEQFELAAGSAVRVDGLASTVSVASVADSRCPVDVTCISAGDAVVIVQVDEDGRMRRDTLRLVTVPKSVPLSRGRLELLDVHPLPRAADRDRLSTAGLRGTAP